MYIVNEYCTPQVAISILYFTLIVYVFQWLSRRSGWDHGPKTITQIRQEAADVSKLLSYFNDVISNDSA